MTHQQNHRVLSADAEQILEVLTRRQFTAPHGSIQHALEATIAEVGCCPQAVQTAMRWLQLDWNRPVGRLRRTELTQLARSIHRFWQQTVAKPADETPANS